jgi:xylulokinase
MKHFVLCADIGTSSLKSALIDIDEYVCENRLRAFVKESYPSEYKPQKETCADDWRCAFTRAVKKLFVQCPQDGSYVIEAVCVSGNGPSVVCLDHEGDVIKTLHWYDPAAHIDGVDSFFLPHIASFMQTEKSIYNKTTSFMSTQEWLSFCLGAERVTVLPSPEYKKYYWDAEQFQRLSLDENMFSPFVALGSVIGKISAQSAAENDLTEGTPIVSGGPDFIMALLGSGLTQAGRVCDRAGSSEGINICTTSAVPAKNDIRVLPSCIEGLWNVSVVLQESGSLFENYRIASGQHNKTYDETLKGLVKNLSRPFRIETMPVVLRKILTNVCYAIDKLSSAGFTFNEMVITGGQAKSKLWNEIKADITDCTMLLPSISDAELTGGAVCAMSALKNLPSLRQESERLVSIKEKISPL